MRRTFPIREFSFLLILVCAIVVGALMVAPFLAALLWAAVLTLLTYPVFARAKRRLESGPLQKFAPSAAALVAVFFTIFIVVVPLTAVVFGLVVQTQGLATGAVTDGDQGVVHSFLTQLDQQIRPLAARLGSADFSAVSYWAENQDRIVASLRAPAAALAQRAGVATVMMVIALLTQFFMLRDGHRLLPVVRDLMPIPVAKTDALLARLRETVWAVFVGTVLVAAIQGTAMGIAFAVAGVPNALILGVVTFLLSIVPLLGSPVVYVPVGLGLLLQGNTTGAIGVLLFGFLIVSNIDNALRPFLIGGRIDLHPMVIFFAILGGVLLFGPVGVMAGPMAVTILFALAEVYRESNTESNQSAEPVDLPA